MRCPKCGCQDDKVIDSRSSREGATIRRRRECLQCGKRFTTYEKIEEIPYMVVKKDGRMRVYACTLVDDDEDYDLGGSLAESMSAEIRLRHQRCYSCFKFGASCSEL